jgi:hypothetical protein
MNGNKIKLIRPETLEFIGLYQQLKGKAFQNNAELANLLGFNSAASITEIVKQRQNIDPAKFRKFKESYGKLIQPGQPALEAAAPDFKGIPMYDINIANSAVNIEATRPIGYMGFPGIEDCDFALPVFDNAMQPYLESGSWVALKIIADGKVLPGEVYYIEWGEYRMFKRLLAGPTADEFIAHSDNVTEMAGNAQRYPPFTLKQSDITRLGLVKHSHKQHHY